jgi:hypothetical protein
MAKCSRGYHYIKAAKKASNYMNFYGFQLLKKVNYAKKWSFILS